MSELEDKINSLLSSPEELEKITKIAKSIMSDGGMSSATESTDSGSTSSGNTKDRTPGGDSGPSGASILGGLDPGMLASLGKLMTKAGGSGDKQALIKALRPFLSEKRGDKLSRAVQLARMAKLAGSAFSEFGGDKS